MTAQVDEYELNKAFDKAEEMFGILVGMRALGDLLCDSRFVARAGKGKCQGDFKQASWKSDSGGKAHVVHAFRFGTENGHGRVYPAVPHFEEYVEVDRSALFGIDDFAGILDSRGFIIRAI